MDTRSIWQPWQDVQRLQHEMERLFSGLAPGRRGPLTGDFPPLNVTRTEGGLTVDALCPGVDRESIDVTVIGDAVTIRCERKPPADLPADRCYRRERPVGQSVRTIAVGERFDPERTQATYTNGILHVQLTAAAEARPMKIPVQG